MSEESSEYEWMTKAKCIHWLTRDWCVSRRDAEESWAVVLDDDSVKKSDNTDDKPRQALIATRLVKTRQSSVMA